VSNEITSLDDFLAAPLEERLRSVLDASGAAIARAHLGEAAFAEFRAMAERAAPRLNQRVMALDGPVNLIFVPGIMGSTLGSSTLGGTLWLDFRAVKRLNELRLAPDGRSDADEALRIKPLTIDQVYAGFLRAVIDSDDFTHVFHAFDWRKSLTLEAGALRDAIVRAYADNGGQRVHLVGHSMGGLLIRAALDAHRDELSPRLGRIVFIGTPHYGSPAIGGYLKNHFWGWEMLTALRRMVSRETFRSFWGALGLLPAPAGVYPGTRNGEDHPCANFDLYSAHAWNLDLQPAEEKDLQRVLDGAAGLHERLHAAHGTLPRALRDRMCVIAGVGYKTLFRLQYRSFKLPFWRDMDKVIERRAGDPHREGDGRVPLASAALEHVGETRYVKGVHGELPQIPAVYGDVFRWLKNEALRLPTTPQGALTAVLGPATGRSDTPVLDGSVRANAADNEDPGYLNFDEPELAEVERLVEEIASGRRREDFLQARLL
jgi:pimeloyl-ACP methyl ester carboxylesterase